ncbi:hypothetical protein VTK26DRAFT_64 [Humicola hyalothermophila]
MASVFTHGRYKDDSGASTPTYGDLIYELYRPIKLPVSATNYTDQRGKTFDTGGRDYWQTPLGKDLLILELDTRFPAGKDEIFNPEIMNWEAVKASGSSLLTISYLNHYIYSQIHGYDYKFLHANKIEGHYDTWIKPQGFRKMLSSYKFVVFIDADAIIQHLEVPMEFLFNRWNIAPNTSIAMPVDTQQVSEEKGNISVDSKGKVVLNSGVVVAQNLPLTEEMLEAWAECTTEKRYPGCAKWKTKWSHEQRAFSEYIRYDFNPDGDNIVEIPCNDANGFPGLKGKWGVVDDCQGEFIRHYTINKGQAKTSTAETLMQTVGELLQKDWARLSDKLLVEEQEPDDADDEAGAQQGSG